MVDGVDDGDELAGKIAATNDPYVFPPAAALIAGR